MSTIIHTPDIRTTINWASGTSTEIFIYPADGSFADRRFLFRISTATVEAEESNFSFFEGITRHLMILKGELELIHADRYTRYLKPFDQDTFSGEWDTKSKGRVTDFNLMLKDAVTGSLKHYSIRPGESATFTIETDYHFLYVADGNLVSTTGDVAKTGDLIQMHQGSIELRGVADIIEVRVTLR